MSFLDLFKKKTLVILGREGVTKQDIQASRKSPAVIEAAARVADHAIPLGEYYQQNTWCGDNPQVDRAWQATEAELQKLAKAMKQHGRIRA